MSRRRPWVERPALSDHRRQQARRRFPGLLLAILLWPAPASAAEQADRAEDPAGLQEGASPAGPCDHSALFDLDVVDLHSHVFNLDYVPLKAIFYRFGVPWPAAGALAGILHRATETLDPEEDVAPVVVPEPAAEMTAAAALARLEGRLIAADADALKDLERYRAEMVKALERHRLGEAAAAEPALAVRGEQRRQARRALSQELAGLDSLTLLVEIVVQSFLRSDDAETEPRRLPEALREQRLLGALDTLEVLMKKEPHIARRQASDFPEVDLFVHHMMDLERVYGEQPPLRFEDQIRNVARLDLGFAGKLRFFVAFDPFRGGWREVERGVEAGAIGVKFYPPSGYRPTATCIPAKPRWTFPLTASCARRRQHRARYGGLKPEDIDALNLEFFRYAAENDLPIFSHHNTRGFEAGRDYGRQMGAPCYWQRAFRRLRARNHPLPRVILAHAGGPAPWFGQGDWEGSYAQQAYNLCVLFDNVYCDFGYPALVLAPEGQAAIAERLTSLMSRDVDPSRGIPENLCDYAGDAPARFHLGDKIIYGSDWLVSVASERRDFACRFNEVFQAPELLPHRAGFFGANARRALGLASTPGG